MINFIFEQNDKKTHFTPIELWLLMSVPNLLDN